MTPRGPWNPNAWNSYTASNVARQGSAVNCIVAGARGRAVGKTVGDVHGEILG
jgi:hypothetical protein